MKFLLLFLLLPLAAMARESIRIAAAANLVYALEPLHAEFARAEPDVDLAMNTGASGNLVAQITHGAPFDVFLSADVEYPQALIRQGAAVETSFTVFAVGRLVLWTTRPETAFPSIEELVDGPDVQNLAIANPRTAPYGRAAVEALKKMGRWERVESRIITGENITQTAQFVETGNADAGFVAMSLVLSPRLKGRGRWLEVPPTLYSPLEHAAVLTPRGQASPAASRYLAFLRSPAAQAVFARFGYRSPE